ncbi:MAG: QVPTGV class sortase B protein-sorting domain-containing protein [Oscillospiraceae bacterium]|nr:QVPTGV class sortase B protein-sorting domain-containing protein [Oscillospiraceae bacterium]
MKKITSVLAALIAAAALSVNVAADPEPAPVPGADPGAAAITGDYGNASASNTSFSFNKYLVLDKNANVPNTEFTFTIVPDPATVTTHLTEEKVELYQGVTATVGGVTYPKFTDGTASFVEGMPTTAGGTAATFTNNKGDTTATIGITSDTSKKYATDGLIVDFSNIVFEEPGVYRYKVTEILPTTGGAYTPLTETERTLDVYVGDTETKTSGSTYTNLAIEGYVLYDSVVSGATLNFGTEEAAADGVGYNESELLTGVGKKSSGFVNNYETHNLTIGKEVSGNQASKDKYFKFTVTIGNAVKGDKYTVAVLKSEEDTANRVFANADESVVANAATTVSGSNVKELEVGDGGTVTQDFYLHDGQYITICGLGKGVEYSVEENEEDYTKTKRIAQGLSSLNWDGTSGFDALLDDVSGSIEGADIHTGYTNSRTGFVPTGVILSVAAPAAIGVVVIGGIIYLAVRRRKEEDEEE